jgi:hypothetical protein
MKGPVREVVDLITGSTASLLLALCGLAGIVIGVVVNPIAAALASAALLTAIVALLVFVLRQKSAFAGPYEILEETIIWDLVAPDGKLAYLEKRQKVRFNYLVVVQLERAMGDGGDLFHSFECDYGEEIKRLRRDGEEALLILMKPERIRDEEAVLYSKRGMTDLFTSPEEWISFGFQAASKKSEFVIKFPVGVQVRNVRIKGPTGHGSRPVSADELTEEQGRSVLRLKGRSYREHDSVKVSWSW